MGMDDPYGDNKSDDMGVGSNNRRIDKSVIWITRQIRGK
jgi:hypothetical protein